MSYLLHIATAVPEFKVEKEDLLNFYSRSVVTEDPARFAQKLAFLGRKTKIDTRYSCLPDYKGERYELFTDGKYDPSVEKRMGIYREKIGPLSSKAVDRVFAESHARPTDVTHLITVSCTGLFAPGLEFLLADQYGLQHAEKTAINFLGCYAAIKALKQAHTIAQADPGACILIVSAELCSLHFHPSTLDDELISNLLFSDGAAAVLMCGAKNKLAQNKVLLQIDAIGSAFIPDTSGLMTWTISSSAFKMHLGSEVVQAIKGNIRKAMEDFAGQFLDETDYWAIHPGGVKIVEAVQQSLALDTSQVSDSLSVLQDYGNMSSPTVLFILNKIFQRVKQAQDPAQKNILACAFGPGLTIELLRLSSVDTRVQIPFTSLAQNVVSAPLL